MKCRGLVGMTMFFVVLATAQAQPKPPPTLTIEPVTPPRVVHRRITFLSAAERHEFLSVHDPEYRSAYNWRRGGTALAGIGGGIGSLVGFISFLTGDFFSDGKTGTISGLVIVVASLAIGLPMAFRANSRMRAIRSRYPTVRVGARRRSGSVQLEWDY